MYLKKCDASVTQYRSSLVDIKMLHLCPAGNNPFISAALCDRVVFSEFLNRQTAELLDKRNGTNTKCNP